MCRDKARRRDLEEVLEERRKKFGKFRMCMILGIDPHNFPRLCEEERTELKILEEITGKKIKNEKDLQEALEALQGKRKEER